VRTLVVPNDEVTWDHEPGAKGSAFQAVLTPPAACASRADVGPARIVGTEYGSFKDPNEPEEWKPNGLGTEYPRKQHSGLVIFMSKSHGDRLRSLGDQGKLAPVAREMAWASEPTGTEDDLQGRMDKGWTKWVSDFKTST
jgi:hypothetical protein